jgi:DNA-binding NarL/FixJ family response regulator
MKLRAVIADDNVLVLQRLASLLEVEFLVVAVAENGQAAVECVRRHQPDVVILDLSMPFLNGIEVTKELTRMPSPPAVVICSIDDDRDIVEAARHAGALGYVFKMRIARDLVKAVHSVARGESFTSSL